MIETMNVGRDDVARAARSEPAWLSLGLGLRTRKARRQPRFFGSSGSENGRKPRRRPVFSTGWRHLWRHFGRKAASGEVLSELGDRIL